MDSAVETPVENVPEEPSDMLTVNEDYIFEFRTVQSSAFRVLIEALKEIERLSSSVSLNGKTVCIK